MENITQFTPIPKRQPASPRKIQLLPGDEIGIIRTVAGSNTKRTTFLTVIEAVTGQSERAYHCASRDDSTLRVVIYQSQLSDCLLRLRSRAKAPAVCVNGRIPEFWSIIRQPADRNLEPDTDFDPHTVAVLDRTTKKVSRVTREARGALTLMTCDCAEAPRDARHPFCAHQRAVIRQPFAGVARLFKDPSLAVAA